MNLLDTHTTFKLNADGLFREHSQAITSDFIDDLKAERVAKSGQRSGNYERVASVPTFVWEQWIREGRDPQNATARQIVGWLNAGSLQHFVATNKRV